MVSESSQRPSIAASRASSIICRRVIVFGSAK
jgi:hypothetical protein